MSPKASEALARGLKHHRASQLSEAVAAYDEALSASPDSVAALVNKGAALRRLGKPQEAMACYWLAIALQPDNRQAWLNAGNALADMGRAEEAASVFRSALQRWPEMPEAWLGTAMGLLKRGRRRAGETCLRRALALRQDSVEPRLHLAALLENYRQFGEALKEYRKVCRLAPRNASAQIGVGRTLTSLGRLAEADEILSKVLASAPDNVDAHLALARLHLLKGEFAAGLREYEWRRRSAKASPQLSGPEWDGSAPAGKLILIHADQDPGETLLFARYIPALAKLGARVAVVCQGPLVGLLQRLEGVASVQSTWTPLPACDFHIALSSLPLRMESRLADIPSPAPYLTAVTTPPPLPVPVGTRLKVGLAWAETFGQDQVNDPSLSLEELLPILGLPGLAAYSLQAGPRGADVWRCAHPALIADLSPVNPDLETTASLVSLLDLVITADTTVAHLAAALGKPVWLLLPQAPHWCWQLERDDSPWYPTMRLFRQTTAGEWAPVIDRVAEELRALVACRPLPSAEATEIIVNSVFPKVIHHGGTESTEKKEDSSPCPPCLRGEPLSPEPRFSMTAPRAFLTDPGIRFLVDRERSGRGYEYATRSFLDTHLQPGDLFIDVGAHWGIMSLQAATRWPGQVEVLAIEALPENLPHLRRWITDNHASESVEVVAAAAADFFGRGRLKPESTMGHRLIPAADGPIPVVTVDGLLAERPRLRSRRAIIKIDVEGAEPEVIAGLENLLGAGLVAAIIWERGGEYDRPEGKARVQRLRDRLTQHGFTAWRFASEDDAGPLIPFPGSSPGNSDGWSGNVIELAAGIEPLASYGQPRPAPVSQPADPALDAIMQARRHFQAALRAQAAGKLKDASIAYHQAASLDGRLPEIFNNLGILLRELKRYPAATASYRRAVGLIAEPATVSNLANVLREQGNVAQALSLSHHALALRPSDPGTLHNIALAYRDIGRYPEAVKCFDRALAVAPKDAECRWDSALTLLQAGDYARGFPAYESRRQLKRAHTRKFPLPTWDGTPLEGRSIFLHDEQGFGDVLQFARFIPEMKRRGAGRIVLECQPELMRLMALTPGVDTVVPRGKSVPDCDVCAALLSLPALFGTTLENLPAEVPYLRAPKPAFRLPGVPGLRIGLVWAGKPTPRDRSCPLELLLPLFSDPRLFVFSLQVGARARDLKATGADAFIHDLSPRLEDFAETAAVLRQLDLLVSIDTAVAHLAGALGVRTYLLLRHCSDWRWFDSGEHSPWYPTFRLFRQHRPDHWDGTLDELKTALTDFDAEFVKKVRQGF